LKNDRLVTPSIVVYKEGDSTIYFDDYQEEAVTKWVSDQQFPLVSFLNEFNFESLTSQKRRLVVGVVDSNAAVTEKFAENLRKSAARFTSDFLFALLDGVHFEKWVANYGITAEHLPNVLVLDEANEIFYINLEKKYTSDTTIDNFLDDVKKGVVKSKVVSYVNYYTNKLNKFMIWSGHLILENMILVGVVSVSMVGLCFWAIFRSTSSTPNTPKQSKAD